MPLFFRNIYLSEGGISIISEYVKIKCVIQMYLSLFCKSLKNK